MDMLRVHFGGSNRKYEKQMKTFHAEGIELWDCGSTGKGHWTNRNGLMPDTPAARELLKKVGGTICRDQPGYLKESNMRRML
jgi:hypothetical protein